MGWFLLPVMNLRCVLSAGLSVSRSGRLALVPPCSDFWFWPRLLLTFSFYVPLSFSFLPSDCSLSLSRRSRLRLQCFHWCIQIFIVIINSGRRTDVHLSPWVSVEFQMKRWLLSWERECVELTDVSHYSPTRPEVREAHSSVFKCWL